MFKDNAFKYVAPQSEAGGKSKVFAVEAKYVNAKQQQQQQQVRDDRAPPHTSQEHVHQPQPPPQQQKQRIHIVRQNQGDKRVAAAKSRAKKRKAVTPEDESTLSMDSIEWSSTSYNVTSLVRAYSHQFPLLVKVIHGYDGDIGATLAVGQVLQIHSSGRQQRIVVEDSQARQLSIPIDYPIEVNVLQQNDRVWMKLRDVILSRELPLRVRVVNTIGNTAEAAARHIVGEDLQLHKLKEDTFLRANSIHDGWIDQTEIAHLPSFMTAQFVVADDMRGASTGEWRDYQGMFSRSVRHLNFSLMNGYPGMYVDGAMPTLLLPEDASRTNSNKSSSHSSSIKRLMEPALGIYANVPSNERKREGSQIFYDNQSFSTSDEDLNKSPQFSLPAQSISDDFHEPDIVTHFDQHGVLQSPSPKFIAPPAAAQSPPSTSAGAQSDTYFFAAPVTPKEKPLPIKPKPTGTRLTVSPEIHSPAARTPRADTPDDDVDVEEMFDNVIKVGEETLEKQRKEEEAKALQLEQAEQRRAAEEETRMRIEEARLRQEREQRAEENRALELQQHQQQISPKLNKDLIEASIRTPTETAKEHEVFFDTDEELRLRKEQQERERIASEALLRREREEVKRRSMREHDVRPPPPPSHPPPSTSQLPLSAAPGGEINLDEQPKSQQAPETGAARQSRSNTVTSDEVFEDNESRRVLSLLNKFEGSTPDVHLAGARRSRPVSRSGSRSGKNHAGSYISETSSGTPMGVIQPTVLQRKESLKENMNRHLSTHSDSHASDVKSAIKSMEDVPSRTSSLTVEDVCACLKLLNMDVHISEFRSSQVDGNTLGDLKETTLLNEFHFTPFNASKLMRFSRGWRPKLT